MIENSHEGNPNLFIDAIKETNNIKVDDTFSNSFRLEKEKELFLQNTQKTKNRLKDIFTNPVFQNIAIFGASALSTTIVNFLEDNLISKIKYIFDNDSSKHGKYIYGCNIPISSISQINESDIDVILISTYLFEKEIYGQLIEIGIDENRIVALN